MLDAIYETLCHHHIMSCLQPKLPCRSIIFLWVECSQVFPHPRVLTRRFGLLKNEQRRHGTQRMGFLRFWEKKKQTAKRRAATMSHG